MGARPPGRGPPTTPSGMPLPDSRFSAEKCFLSRAAGDGEFGGFAVRREKEIAVLCFPPGAVIVCVRFFTVSFSSFCVCAPFCGAVDDFSGRAV